MTGRSVDEWIGRTPDAKVPTSVQLRIWAREGGRCHITGRKIGPGEPWDLEHIKPLSLGGEHRERNLAPALKEAHKRKTAEEAGVRAKADRMAKKHLGIKSRSGPAMPGTYASGWKKPMRGKPFRRNEEHDNG